MHTTDPSARAAYIAGLRALTEFLLSNPAVPIPAYGSDVFITTDGTDDQRRAEVEHIAALLNVKPTDQWGHYRASLKFGPIEYRAVAIPNADAAANEALMTYAGNFSPDREEAPRTQ